MAWMFFMPSSPVYLLSQEKEDEARKALQWLRGSNYDIDKEIQQASAFQMHIQGSAKRQAQGCVNAAV